MKRLTGSFRLKIQTKKKIKPKEGTESKRWNTTHCVRIWNHTEPNRFGLRVTLFEDINWYLTHTNLFILRFDVVRRTINYIYVLQNNNNYILWLTINIKYSMSKDKKKIWQKKNWELIWSYWNLRLLLYKCNILGWRLWRNLNLNNFINWNQNEKKIR